MSLPQPDFGVLRKAQRGDERAFSIIVRAYQVPVFNYVLRLVGDRSLAEDLTQEVFLRVFQGLPRFSLRSKFTTWLFQVTKNRVLDELRAVERRPRAVVDIDDVPPLEVLDAPFERLEAIDAVWRAVENLNVDLKMALLLRDIVGLSYTEIADSLEVTLATVKWRIYKAREDVQLALAREGIHLYGDEPAAVAAVAAADVAAARRSGRLRLRHAQSHWPSAAGRRAICGSPAVAHLRLRLLDVVGDAAEGRAPRVEVEHEVRGARVAVARLADRAGVEQPARACRGRAPCRPARAPPSSSVSRARPASAAWLWPTSTSGSSVSSERRERGLVREHVLPHGVARAAVEERDAVAPRRAARAPSRKSRASSSSTPRVHARRGAGVAAELVEVDRSEHGEVVVPGRGRRCTRADERAALVRLRPVADEVAEAPELVRRRPRRSPRAPPRARGGSRGCRR